MNKEFDRPFSPEFLKAFSHLLFGNSEGPGEVLQGTGPSFQEREDFPIDLPIYSAS